MAQALSLVPQQSPTGLCLTGEAENLVAVRLERLGTSSVPISYQRPGGFLESLWPSVSEQPGNTGSVLSEGPGGSNGANHLDVERKGRSSFCCALLNPAAAGKCAPAFSWPLDNPDGSSGDSQLWPADIKSAITLT